MELIKDLLQASLSSIEGRIRKGKVLQLCDKYKWDKIDLYSILFYEKVELPWRLKARECVIDKRVQIVLKETYDDNYYISFIEKKYLPNGEMSITSSKEEDEEIFKYNLL